MRVVPLDDEQGHVALGLVLRHLANTGIFMHTTAHPDDENNGLLVMLNRGQGYRTALATATRGNGGQNEIGPEIFEALGVLRTGELAALHRFDGAEQYFTRAVDFGYSFGIDETFEKWGREEITADYVRLIRMIRPDVIVTLPPTGNAGGQHHMASAVITRDAYKLAGDPTKFPEQIKDGLRAWQPKKLYHCAGVRVPGRAAGGRHGDARQLRRLRRAARQDLQRDRQPRRAACTSARAWASCCRCRRRHATATLPAGRDDDAGTDAEGRDVAVRRRRQQPDEPGAGSPARRAPKDLTEGLTAIANATQAAQKAFDTVNDEATLKPLQDGLFAVRVLRRELRSMAIDEAGKYEIDFRLRQKEGEFQQAIALAHGIKIEALADDGVVVPGQPVKVNVIVANRGDGEWRSRT